MKAQKSDMKSIDAQADELLAKLTLREKISLLSGIDNWHTAAIERLGIPSLTMTDGPHGVRTGSNSLERVVSPATAFPPGIAMASTWNPALIERVGAALAEETRALGCDILLGPCVNIVRSPLGGRNFETYSEDPFLAGKIATAYVKGVQSRQVGTSLKHYALNNQEFERNRGSSVVDERTMREIYLPAFEVTVRDAQPWTVMCSYNRINGIYASENYYTLTEILRNEWGFEGIVVSDWGANHTIVESVEAGLDIEMPGPAKYYGNLLEDAVQTWQIDEAVIDHAARRILKLLLRSGKLGDPAKLPPGSVNTPAHQALARETAEESIVLLKNEGDLLPFDMSKLHSLAVIGPNALDNPVAGGGSSYVEPPYQVSPLDGLKKLLGSKVDVRYAQGCSNAVDPLSIPAGYFGAGLDVEFFGSLDFSGEVLQKRSDPKIEFRWFSSPPAEMVDRTHFSARWTGKLTAPQSGKYTLWLINSDRCRLFLNGKLVLDNTTEEIPHMDLYGKAVKLAKPVEFEFEAGKAVDLVIEFIKCYKESAAVLGLRYTAPVADQVLLAEAVAAASQSDAAVVCVGMPLHFETEGRDRSQMTLPGMQDELVRAVVKANPNTVVVVTCGAPVAMPWIAEAPAVIDCLYAGMEGGSALAAILCGDANPSGKLTETFPVKLEDNPAYLYYPGGREVQFGEGIFVGYRYYDQKGVAPLFPFGHGLSYTTFQYSDIKVPASVEPGSSFEVSVKVTNTGKRAGKEVVQLYIHDKESSLARPPKELKGFQKIELKPGKSSHVTFSVDPRALSFYDSYRGDWVAEAGEFEALVGSSSRDIRAQASFILKG